MRSASSTLIYVITTGGPGTATETMTLYTYALGFRMLEVGKASALGVITLIIVGDDDRRPDPPDCRAAGGRRSE